MLLEDVLWQHAQFTVSHGLSILAVIITTAAGHSALDDLKAHKFFSAATMAILTIIGTTYILTVSAGRNAAHMYEKSTAIKDRNTSRESTRKDLTEARQEHKNSKSQEPKHCENPNLKRCYAQKATSDKAWDRVKLLETKLTEHGPIEERAWSHIAKVFVLLKRSPDSQETVEDSLALVMPFILVILSEIGTVLFITRGLKPRNIYTNSVTKTIPKTVPDIQKTVPDTPKTIKPLRQTKPRHKDRLTKAQAIQDLITMLALGQSITTQDMLAKRWNRPKQTVSTWLRDWEREGLIPERKKKGRSMVIEKNKA